MANTRDIKKRIRSVKNIAQITKAMEVVSMTKMRRSQQFALAARPCALAAIDMIKNIIAYAPKVHIPDMLKERKIRRAVVVVITTDKGLVGGFNDAILKQAEHRIKLLRDGGVKVGVVAVGRKSKEHFERKGIKLLREFTEFGDYTEFNETKPIADVLLAGYKGKKWDAVYVSYTHFKTTLKQETVERKILPTTEPALEDIIQEIIPEYGRYSEMRKTRQENQVRYNYTYTFEPNAEAIVQELVEDLIRVALHHIVLESNASEHSARMITMKNASDNAQDLQSKLTITYNKVRQAGITAELSEIVAGAEALQ